PGFVLGEAAFFDDPVNMDRQYGFRQMGVGVLDAKVAKDVAAAFGDAVFGRSAGVFHRGCSLLFCLSCNSMSSFFDGPIQRSGLTGRGGMFLLIDSVSHMWG